MRTLPLTYVAVVNRQTLPETTSPDFSFRYIDIGQVDSVGKITIPTDLTSFRNSPSRARRMAPAGATIISTVRTYLRAIAQVPEHEDSLVFSTGFATLEATSGDPRFLSYACSATPFIEEVVARSTGVSYPAINASDMAAIPLPWPSIQEQRRIADFLDNRVTRIDQIIATRRQQGRVLSDLEQSSLGQIVDSIARDWKIAPLRRFCSGIEQGGSPVAEDTPAGIGECGILKTNAIFRGHFDASANKKVAPSLVAAGHKVHTGDLLVTRGSGSADLVGDVAVAEVLPETALYLSDLIYRIVMPTASSDYLALAMLSPLGRSTLRANVRQGSGPAKARGDDILALPIPTAPAALQQVAVNESKALRASTSAAKEVISLSISLLQEYKQSLITAAVTGEFDVTTASTKIPE